MFFQVNFQTLFQRLTHNAIYWNRMLKKKFFRFIQQFTRTDEDLMFSYFKTDTFNVGK